ncbi:hypothetical protein TEA_029759 [Camellia sinensis var. sinensis]|uniref:non-specific serine/threonine protein kinase n=1 Tax=Camellia sinensis var. sinensis TaxID=542762 RepID=A0A4S4DFR3_CAMSN|nr:hypothetical protein TEA_029759 [Camellia sinensis var. sinensis]
METSQLLWDVNMSLNQLKGNIPDELFQLKNLTYLALAVNGLTGILPDSLSNLTELTDLVLAVNYFNGKIPEGLGALTKLEIMNFHTNDFQGTIPASISNCTALREIALSENLLTGDIPSELGAKLYNLEKLYLLDNQLTGRIPVTLSNLSHLTLLDLSLNKLSGEVPLELGKLQKLEILYLHSNDLVSNSNNSFLMAFSNCSFLQKLHLGSCLLAESLPTSIGRLSKDLYYFNILNNRMTGNIPEGIGNLSGLVSLYLEGTIPDTLKKIAYLEVLDLSYNKLTGKVPSWIDDNQMLKNLNLSYNRLTGEVPIAGKFDHLRRSSLMGNAGLCGGSQILGLPPCEVTKRKHKTRKWVYYVLAISLSCMLLLIMLIAISVRHRFFKNETKEQLMVPLGHRGTHTLTQRELEIATDGFDKANLLGRGSFGSVYKAIIDEGKTVVAVKVLQECSQSYRNLKRECQILSEIRHRNLVKMVGVSWNSKFKAIVLEFMGNGNLEQHLHPSGSEEGRCKLTLMERLQIAIDVAHGLEYLHEGCSSQIVHCDLKPQNVLLDDDMVAHVADFGIAKLILDHNPKGDYNSTTNFLRGTVGYIPPEYAQGIEVSASGDVYSFGVIMLEMITGKKPTNQMFSDGIDLRKWVWSAFPDRILDVVDISLKQEANETDGSGALILGVVPNCSPAELKAAFRTRVKQYHPDVRKDGELSDTMIRHVIQAYQILSKYTKTEIIERECLDPFDEPECEAFDIFINEVLCVGKGCPYSCVERAPHAFRFASSTGTAHATSQGHGEDYHVQLAVGQCPRSCIHYVTPSQRVVLEELLHSILDMPYDTSAEADLLYSLIVKAKFENNRYQKPKKQPKVSTDRVDWF